MRKLYAIKLFFLCFFHLQISEANQWLIKLDSPFSEYENQLQSDPDSVLNSLLDSRPIDSKSNLYQAQYHFLLSQTYYTLVFPKKALEQARKGIEILSTIDEPWLLNRLQLAQSMAYDISGEPAKGLEAVNESIEWAQQNKDNNLLIESLTTRGYILLSMVEYVRSLETLHQAYQLATVNENYEKAEVAGIIALVYEYRRESELSIPFFQEAVDYHRSKENWLELSIALYGLGKANLYTGNTSQGRNELQESANLSARINDYQGESYALKELAGLAIKEKKYVQAEQMLLKALKAFSEANNSLMLFDTYKVLSNLKLKSNKIEDSQGYLDLARSYINKDQHPNQYISLQKLATDILASQGHYEKAYKDLKKVIFTEKQLIVKQSTEQLHQLRSKFELDTKEKENKILAQNMALKNTNLLAKNQENKVLQILFFFAITVSGLLLFIAYRLRKNKKHFEKIANFDGLTGLYTRSKTLDLLQENYDISQQNDLQFCIGMIDLDHFKKINDEYGHSVGDLVLKELGLIFKDVFRETDICGRFGGEEFLVGLPDTSIRDAYKILEKLRINTEKIANEINIEGLAISLSAGLCINNSYNNLDEMIRCADDCLYEAKEKGRNKIQLEVT